MTCAFDKGLMGLRAKRLEPKTMCPEWFQKENILLDVTELSTGETYYVLTALAMAQSLELDHATVMAGIDETVAALKEVSPELAEHNFTKREITDGDGNEVETYVMAPMGYILAMMGFATPRAVKARLEVLIKTLGPRKPKGKRGRKC